MNTKFTQLLTLYVVVFLCGSCARNEHLCDLEISDARVISVDDALQNLNDFLSDVQMEKTKSGGERSVFSVETHYNDYHVTSTGESLPDAYLVNFANEEGFAILGANSAIAPVIAVVEDGNMDWKDILYPHTKSSSRDVYNVYSNDLERELLGPGIDPDRLLSFCVQSALMGCHTESLETKSAYTTEILPLMGGNHNFGQNVTYCHKNNNKFVTNGCASTAISMVMSYKKFPRMTVDKRLLSFDYYNIKDATGIYYGFSDDNIYINLQDYFTNSASIPVSLTTQQKLDLLQKIDPDVITDHGTPSVITDVSFYKTRYKVTSAVYYTLNNIIKNWTGTGTMPAAAVNGIEELGFVNVSKNQTRELNSEQIGIITEMLLKNMPVVICGWSLWSLSSSHYWVIDGIKNNSVETLIHCNWGHSGKYNGWFSSDCIRKNSPVETKTSDSSDNEWNNLIVFSYDVDNSNMYKTINVFYDEHRVTY